MISLSCTRGGLHTSFSEIPDVALVKAVIAHAARLVAQGDTDAAVLDVRRAYFNGGEKRDTFVELPDHVPADMRVSHVGKLRKALYSTRPAAASWGDELGVSCGLVVGTQKRVNMATHDILSSPNLKEKQHSESPLSLTNHLPHDRLDMKYATSVLPAQPLLPILEPCNPRNVMEST